MRLHAWQKILHREEPRRCLYELQRVLDLRAKLLGRLQCTINDEGK
jgi:hypothetical protein